MATRATYKFYNTQLTNSATVYIHYDGYPKGAAQYIDNAMVADGDIKHPQIITVERFIRYNEYAQITQSHSSHGDTDYRYDFHRNGEMSVSKRTIEKVGDEYEENWNLIFTGSIKQFLETYLAEQEA